MRDSLERRSCFRQSDRARLAFFRDIVQRLRNPLAHFFDVDGKRKIAAFEALPKGRFEHLHHPSGSLLLDFERATLADEQANMDKGVGRVAIGYPVVAMADSTALDAFEVNRAGGSQFLVQTCQQRLDIELEVGGV
jgi:hypothetical protein